MPTSNDKSDRPVALTKRERDIVRAILEGCTNRAMATRFGISEQTVKNQLSAIYDKVGVSSRLELALMALQRGLIEPADQPKD